MRTAQLNNNIDSAWRVCLNRALNAKNHSHQIDETLKFIGCLTRLNRKLAAQGQFHLYKNFQETRLAIVMEQTLERLTLQLFRLNLQKEILAIKNKFKKYKEVQHH